MQDQAMGKHAWLWLSVCNGTATRVQTMKTWHIGLAARTHSEDMAYRSSRSCWLAARSQSVTTWLIDPQKISEVVNWSRY